MKLQNEHFHDILEMRSYLKEKIRLNENEEKNKYHKIQNEYLKWINRALKKEGPGYQNFGPVR